MLTVEEEKEIALKIFNILTYMQQVVNGFLRNGATLTEELTNLILNNTKEIIGNTYCNEMITDLHIKFKPEGDKKLITLCCIYDLNIYVSIMEAKKNNQLTPPLTH